MKFGVAVGIFIVMFWASSGEFWGGFGHFSSDFGVTLGIFTGMFRASSGEVWGGFGHFTRDVLGNFR